jgi:hypothetical protein
MEADLYPKVSYPNVIIMILKLSFFKASEYEVAA